MSANQQFQTVADDLKHHLDALLVEVVREPIQAALTQVPIILERPDLTGEQRREAVLMLQLAVMQPLIGSVAAVGHAAGVDLSTVLFHLGEAWEQIRRFGMAEMAKKALGADETTT